MQCSRCHNTKHKACIVGTQQGTCLSLERVREGSLGITEGRIINCLIAVQILSGMFINRNYSSLGLFCEGGETSAKERMNVG